MINVRKLREDTGLSAKAFGARLGLTYKTIKNYECGVNVPIYIELLIRYEFSKYLRDGLDPEPRERHPSWEKIPELEKKVKELTRENKKLKICEYQVVNLKRDKGALLDQLAELQNGRGE